MTIRSLLRHVDAIRWWQAVCPRCLRVHGPAHWLLRTLHTCRRTK